MTFRLAAASTRLSLVGLLFLTVFFWTTRAGSDVPVPDLLSPVTDQTGTLDKAAIAALESRLRGFETEKGSQIAVLIVATTQPETIEQYSMRVAETWKLGRKGVDDGILLLVAKDDRAVRIEVGYGLEGVVSDIHSKRVIEEEIVPRFRQGDFHGGIEAAVGRLIGLVKGESLPEPTPPSVGTSQGGFLDQFLPLVMLFAFVGGGILRAIFGRLAGATLAGALGFAGAWWFLGALGIALLFGLFIFLVTLLAGSRGGFGSGGGGSWSSGGGGFGGGGGGFGGGGASGRW